MPKRRGKNHLTSGRIKEKVEIIESMCRNNGIPAKGKGICKGAEEQAPPLTFTSGWQRLFQESSGGRRDERVGVVQGPSRTFEAMLIVWTPCRWWQVIVCS